MVTVQTKVSGVTFEGRQEIIASLVGDEIVVLEAEPNNPHDPQAIAVWVLTENGSFKVGYIPRDVTHAFAPFLMSADLVPSIKQITGGFTTFDGKKTTMGLILSVEMPEDYSNELPY